jgi:alkyl hydroperoxide reductase subunit AhpF
LRFATSKENSQNRKLSSRNTSKVKGISFNKKAKKWHAQIMIDGISIHIGLFANLEDAKIARVNRANQAFGVYTNACEKL